MRTRVSILLFSIVLGVLSASVLSFAECPNCFWNVKRMSGQGLRSDGRINLNVQIASSWNDPATGTTNSKIQTATLGANSDWNDQTTTGAPGGAQGNYFLNLNQGASQTNVDIRIVQGTPTAGLYAETRGTKSFGLVGSPFTIILPAAAKDWTADTLRAVIAHEIGHALGISHPDSFNKCGHTIMNLPNPGTGGAPAMVTASVQPKDIAEQRRHFQNNLTCPDELRWKEGGLPIPSPTPTPIPTPTPDPTCTDQDQDGVCFFDDCDDNNPAVAFDSDGDHYCYPYDCDDYNANVYPGAPLNYNTEGGEDRDCNGVDDLQQQFGGGGGGGGTYCTPYYWVYYESWDGGLTWEVVDISYAGCW